MNSNTMFKSGIYQIQSIFHPDRVYIGSAINLENRKRHHLSDLRLNKHHSPKLQNHYNKYGVGDLDFSILFPCEKDVLLKYEDFLLKSLDPWFNISKTARSPLGIKRSDETRRKISEAHIGNKHTEESKKKIGDAQRGTKHSYERIEKRRQKRIGQHCSTETKEKIRQSQLGKKRSIDQNLRVRENYWTKAFIKELETGIPMFKIKIYKSRKGIKRTPESIEKGASKLRGRKRDKATVEKIRFALKNLSQEKRDRVTEAGRKIPKQIALIIRAESLNKKNTGDTDRIIANRHNVSIYSVRNIRRGIAYNYKGEIK